MTYHPDFESECRICDTAPTVVVEGHPYPNTRLCGYHFFHDWSKRDWETWNDDDSLPEDI